MVSPFAASLARASDDVERSVADRRLGDGVATASWDGCATSTATTRGLAPMARPPSREYARPMERPQPTVGLDPSTALMRAAGDPPDSDDGPLPRVESIQLARWEGEGGALRESEQRRS
jgi:hypothetical protein